MANIYLKRFGKLDWYAFSGAESFSDGSDPYIGHLELDGEQVDVILDGNGLSLVTECGEEFNRAAESQTELDDIIEAAFTLPRSLTSVALQAMGFTTESGGPYTVRYAAERYEYETRTAAREALEGSGESRTDALARGILSTLG